MNKPNFLTVFVLLAGLANAVPASADAFNNLNGITAGSDPLAIYGPSADSFSTAEYGTRLTQVAVKLSGTPDSGSVTVQLRADSATAPGVLLGTVGSLSDTLLSSSFANYTLTVTSPLALAANTRYWLQLVSNGSSANWAWSFDLSGPGVAGQFAANRNGVFPNTSGPYQAQVVTASPEPASLGLLALGVLGAFGVNRTARSRFCQASRSRA